MAPLERFASRSNVAPSGAGVRAAAPAAGAAAASNGSGHDEASAAVAAWAQDDDWVTEARALLGELAGLVAQLRGAAADGASPFRTPAAT